MKYLLCLLTFVCCGADLTTPVSILPPANHSASGVVRLYDQNKMNFKELRYENLILDSGSTFFIGNQGGAGKATFRDSGTFLNLTQTASGITMAVDNAGGNYAIYATKSAGAAGPVVRVEQNSNAAALSAVNSGTGPGIQASGVIAFQSAGDTSPSNTLSFNLGGPSLFWNNAFISNLVGPSSVVTFGSDANPITTVTYDLGSSSARWKKLWVQDIDCSGVCPGGGGGSSPPFTDTTEIIKGSGDATKRLRFEVDGLTAVTTRTITPQDSNYTLAGLETAQTFTADQTFSENIFAGATGRVIGTGAMPFAAVRAESLMTVSLLTGATYAMTSYPFSGQNNFKITDPVGTSIVDYNVPAVGNRSFSWLGDLYPWTNITYDLGRSGTRWRKLWVQDIDCSGTTCPINPPFSDSTALQKDDGDFTKTLHFQIDTLPTGTDLTLVVKNVGSGSTEYRLPGEDIVNTWTATQIFSSHVLFSTDNASDIGTATTRAGSIYVGSVIRASTASGGTRYCQISGGALVCSNGGTTNFSAASLTGQIISTALAGSGTRCLDADASGNISAVGVASGDCVVSASAPLTVVSGNVACSTCVTDNTSQTITGQKTFSFNLLVGADNTYSFGTDTVRLSSIFAGSVIRASTSSGGSRYCQTSGGGFACSNAGSTTFSAASLTGQVTSAALAGSGTRCIEAANDGSINLASAACAAGTVTAVSGTSPISSSGGTTPAISCSTCVTSVTASGLLSSSGGTTPAITCSTCIGTGSTASLTGTLTFSTGSLIVGSSGNFYDRPIAGNGISCAGVTDGWMAWDTSGHSLLMCAGGSRFKVDLTAY